MINDDAAVAMMIDEIAMDAFPHSSGPSRSGAARSPVQAEDGLGIKALLCVVFEKKEGPSIRWSDPPDAVSTENFKILGRYLLPETFVKGRVVSITLDDSVIVGAPVYIQDSLYQRNCFHFNICVVIDSRAHLERHHDLAQHLATVFHRLEVELKLLSGTETGPNNIIEVPPILTSLREQLNKSCDCYVRVTESQCISFRVRCASLKLGPSIPPAKVPLALVDLVALFGMDGADGEGEGSETLLLDGSARCSVRPVGSVGFEPDPLFLHVVPFIDGLRSIGEIATVSDVAVGVVQNCVRHLLHFNLIGVIDPITRDSRYSLTADFHAAFSHDGVCDDAVCYVMRDAGSASNTKAPVEAVQALYCSLDGWQTTLGEFQQAHTEELHENGVSLRHLIAFGLLRGLIQRIEPFINDGSRSPTKEVAQEREGPPGRVIRPHLNSGGYGGRRVASDASETESIGSE